MGSKGGIEEKLMPQANIPILSIRSGKFRRYHKNKILNIIDPTTIFKNIKDLSRFIFGIFDSLKIIKNEDPDMVFLKGGYVSLPFGIACRIKKVPYFIHECDVIPGLANRLLLKGSEKIFVAFPVDNYNAMPQERLIYSGNPIRKDIVSGDAEKARAAFGLDSKLKTVLVIGGSQGSHIINELVAEALEKYLEKFQVIHIAGEYDFDWLEYKSKNLENKDRYKLFTFLAGDLKDAFAVSDIIITRAGNNVLTEVAATKKPAIVIPLESSTNDHQLANAKAYTREGAAYLMLQSHLDPKKLFKETERLLNDSEELKFLSEKVAGFYKEDSADIIADNLIAFYKDTLKEEGKGEKKRSEKSRQNKGSTE